MCISFEHPLTSALLLLLFHETHEKDSFDPSKTSIIYCKKIFTNALLRLFRLGALSAVFFIGKIR